MAAHSYGGPEPVVYIVHAVCTYDLQAAMCRVVGNWLPGEV